MAEVVGGALLSVLVEALPSLLLSSIKEEVMSVTGVKDKLNELESNFKSLQARLDDIEEQLTEASVEERPFDLQTVSYDMDDVLDEWKTWLQTSELNHEHHSSGSDQNHLKHKVLHFFCCFCFIIRDVGEVAEKIREIQPRVNDITTDILRYQLPSSQNTEKYIERHMTTPFIDLQKVKGRDEEKNEVKGQILKAKSNPHIISLVGMGGIGKTTLAQLIYNDGEINTHFEMKIWVCVSKPFDEMRISKAILESLCDSSVHDFKELADVLKEISVSLNKKRFLLVLDDVWNENRSKWEELENVFKCGLPGSTILITTHNETAAIVMGCKPESIHKVGLLTSEECWSIISQIALVHGDRQKLESIGRRIADKCKGLPLTATNVGGLLCLKKSENEWLNVLEKNEWESKDGLDSLMLIYYDLPLPVKRCFSYCAIFPKGFEIEKRRLIGMWIAQGYLKGKKDDDLEMAGMTYFDKEGEDLEKVGEDLEKVGETYFDNLVARALLQISSSNKDCYVLHDVVSELAQTITKTECLMIEALKDTVLNGNSLFRHLTLTIKKDASFPVSIYDLNKLRTLIIQLDKYEPPLTVVELEGIFKHLTYLRTLNLKDCNIKEVPSSINRLVHLRWLDLSKNRFIEELPETLCECFNLQALILNWCESLVKLPKRIGNLINLMYLDIEDSYEIKYLPKGIENLWRLREFTMVIASENENESESFSIAEMRKFKNLRGRLEIRGLGNVITRFDARSARLEKRKSVTELRLSFDGDHVREDEEILEVLEPPSNLEILSINEFKGKMVFPSWMMKLNLLRKLTIKYSENCEKLPPLGKLPCLEELKLADMIVKRVGVEFMGIKEEKDASTTFSSFPKLKTLAFELSWEWEEWDDIDESLMERISNKTITMMPNLQELSIYRCKKLKTLPYYLLSPPITTKLQELDIIDCDVLEQEVQKDKLSHVPHLKIRRVRGMPRHQKQ